MAESPEDGGPVGQAETPDDKRDLEERTSPHTQAYVRMHQVTEVQRTIRVGIIAVAIVLGLGMLVGGVVLVVGEGAVIQAIATGLSVIMAAALPVAVWFKARANFKGTIKDKHGRTVELEASVDAERSSSGLQEDGTNRPEDMV